jgi:hypothetical protein
MNPLLYGSIRTEVITNHLLMHATSLVVLIILLVGLAYVERHSSVLSVLLPIVSVSWAAAMVRFDYFIHRQGVYLAHVEHSAGLFGWESWRASLVATPVLVPLMDALVAMAYVLPTIWIAFKPSRTYLRANGVGWATAYAWLVSVLTVLLLASLTVVPRLAALGAP